METSKNEVKNKKSFIDLDDLEFMGGSYELNQSNINYFEKKLGRKFDLKKYVYDFTRYDLRRSKINILCFCTHWDGDQ
jgi:hypothetical protein